MATWLKMLLQEGKNQSGETVIPPAVVQKAATGVTVYTPIAPYPELSPVVYSGGQRRDTYREKIEHGGSVPGPKDPIAHILFIKSISYSGCRSQVRCVLSSPVCTKTPHTPSSIPASLGRTRRRAAVHAHLSMGRGSDELHAARPLFRNTVNLTALFSNPTGSGISEHTWVWKAMESQAEFEVKGKDIGFSPIGIAGIDSGVVLPRGTVQERGEVWLAKN
ncbi:hypothetical protein C8F04DRAFT_145170 [Mycena alexandri]|uniref:Uncharacterized protein n=1 Tax=Mycena alexandri TaxID=1745969 RepID=A0AAD6T8Y3_9AGAR|nr:hypothetical protein C8F04DRAFT_145170 [Mycena alexandri]